MQGPAVPDLLTQHGLAVVFAWAFAVQAGVPAPAVPMLLGAGALSGSGRMDLAFAILAAMMATVGADVLWYGLGRFYGTRVLGVVSKFSLDSDSLIRHAKERFAAHRVRYVVLAKFLPGANPLAAGLAGAVPLRPERFLLSASAGALLWAGAWITLGYLCADVIGLLGARLATLGTPLLIAIVAALIAYVMVKYARRYRSLRHLRRARITAVELKRRLDAGAPVTIVDLRTPLDIDATPYTIPGARWIPLDALRTSHPPLPKTATWCSTAPSPERRRVPAWPCSSTRSVTEGSIRSVADSKAGARPDSPSSPCGPGRSRDH